MRLRLLACVLVLGCGSACEEISTPPVLPPGFLIEKGPYQSLYGLNGLDRIFYDQDGDRRADVISSFQSGHLVGGEVDTDHDGVIDRWEHYDWDGKLDRVGSALVTPGVVDEWSYTDAQGRLYRRDLDPDADGKTDVWEFYDKGVLHLSYMDTDGDHKADRRIFYSPDGAVVGVETDADEDGVYEKRTGGSVW